MQNSSTRPVDATPVTRIHHEKIGDTGWDLQETVLDMNDMVLWSDNPRLVTHLETGVYDEERIAASLRKTGGYDQLKKSIDEIGQNTPVYVWRANENTKYLVLEGNTRVTCMRELELRYAGGAKAGTFRRIKVRILPPHFGEVERAILLARLHVRKSPNRAWGRYEQARFVYNTVIGGPGHQSLMSVSELAQHIEKSISFVLRLKDAYVFGGKFESSLDDDKAQLKTADQFSILEEISKATGIGPKLRDYDNEEYDSLRADVFEMVNKEVFKEYRDARFMNDFYQNPEIWAALKTGEQHIASKYALEIKQGNNSIKAKVHNFCQAIERSAQDDYGLDDEDVEQLEKTLSLVQNSLHPGIDAFTLDFKKAIDLLSNATLANVKALSPDDKAAFDQAHEYFMMLVERYAKQT